MAQLVLGVAGAVVGGMFGMPQVGWAIGSAIGSAFAPTQKSYGPKLSDLKVTASEYGGALHILEGHPRVAGVVAWSSDKHEIATTTEQGKGGGAESTSYTYECDCFFLLSDAEILGIRRIWSNGKLIWSIADDSDEETIEASEDTTKWKAMRMYSGAADQMPDPVYEAAVGVGNAPAYRGRGGVFFEGLSLGSGGVMPNLTFEVNARVSEEAGVTRRILENFAAIDERFQPPHGAAESVVKMTTIYKNKLRTYNSTGGILISDMPATGAISSPGRGNGDRAVMVFNINGGGTGAAAGYVIAGDGVEKTIILPGGFFLENLGDSSIRFSTYKGNIAVGSASSLVDSGEIGNYGNVFLHSLEGEYLGFAATGQAVSSLALSESILFIHNTGSLNVRQFVVGAGALAEEAAIVLPAGSGYVIYIGEDGLLRCVNEDQIVYVYATDVWDVVRKLEFQYEGVDVDLGPSNALHFSGENGDLLAAVPVEFTIENEDYFDYYRNTAYPWEGWGSVKPSALAASRAGGYIFNLDYYGPDFISISNCRQYIAGETIYPEPQPSVYNLVPGKNAYDLGVIYVNTTANLIKWPDEHRTAGDTEAIAIMRQFTDIPRTSHAHDVYKSSNDLTGTLVNANLKDVAERICFRAGLAPADIDATELSEDWVYALAIPPGPAKAALDQLAAAYYFECVESDKLYFRKRGRPTSLTIPYDDLGAEALLAVQDANDLEIPAQVFVKYMNLDDSYQSGSEVSDRLTTDSTAVNNMELALGFTPAQAKGIADTACLDQNIGSRSLSFALDRRYFELEPTDVVGVQDGFGSTFRARIVKISDASGVRNIEAVADDASVLSATGITSNNYKPDYTVRPRALTDLVVLDIPILRDVDDGPGMYTAGDGLAGTWSGYALFIEGLQVSTSTTGAAMGTATDVLGGWASGLVDEVNSVTVQLNPGDQITSITHAQLTSTILNYAAIGVHGRWELLQYRSAELIGTGLYRLRGLLRGQLGTEHLTGTHAIGDRFVALDGAGMLRPAASIADIMTPRDYQGVTVGALVSSAPVQTVTNEGVGMRPYAPVNLRQSHSGTDIVLAWDRRTRYQTNLLTDVVPLGEATEQYQVDVYDGPTVVRTLTTSTPAATYTAAQQTADFGAPQAAVDVRVYQISATVGRGTPLIYEA